MFNWGKKKSKNSNKPRAAPQAQKHPQYKSNSPRRPNGPASPQPHSINRTNFPSHSTRQNNGSYPNHKAKPSVRPNYQQRHLQPQQQQTANHSVDDDESEEDDMFGGMVMNEEDEEEDEQQSTQSKQTETRQRTMVYTNV